MAVFSFNVSVVSRSPRKGSPGNAVQSAADIARERLTDDRTGTAYDYRAKGGIEFKGIFTPKGAPKWMQDRDTLWNAVEEREDESTRPDTAQVATRLIIAIPHELNERERLWLVKDFARELSRKGMVFEPYEPKGVAMRIEGDTIYLTRKRHLAQFMTHDGKVKSTSQRERTVSSSLDVPMAHLTRVLDELTSGAEVFE